MVLSLQIIFLKCLLLLSLLKKAKRQFISALWQIHNLKRCLRISGQKFIRIRIARFIQNQLDTCPKEMLSAKG